MLQHSVSNVGSGFACYLLARCYAEDDTVRWPYVRSKVGPPLVFVREKLPVTN